MWGSLSEVGLWVVVVGEGRAQEALVSSLSVSAVALLSLHVWVAPLQLLGLARVVRLGEVGCALLLLLLLVPGNVVRLGGVVALAAMVLVVWFAALLFTPCA